MSFTKIILQALIYLYPSGFGALTKDTMYKNDDKMNTDETSLKLGHLQ